MNITMLMITNNVLKSHKVPTQFSINSTVLDKEE